MTPDFIGTVSLGKTSPYGTCITNASDLWDCIT